MLGKLIKYDLKASAKIFLLLHGLFLAACLLCRLFFLNRLDFFHASEESLISSIAVMISLVILLITGANIASWLLIAFRFYRSLFSREGYLSWTLPVSGLQHLWSRIISGCLFMALDAVIIAAGVLLLTTGSNVTEAYSVIAEDVAVELGMPLSRFGAYMFLFSILACISTVVMTYFCITVGQLFPSHRILCALAAYFITTLVVQLISFFILFATGLFPGYSYFLSKGETVAEHTFALLTLSTVMMLIITFFQYICTHFIIKKKINLL